MGLSIGRMPFLLADRQHQSQQRRMTIQEVGVTCVLFVSLTPVYILFNGVISVELSEVDDESVRVCERLRRRASHGFFTCLNCRMSIYRVFQKKRNPGFNFGITLVNVQQF